MFEGEEFEINNPGFFQAVRHIAGLDWNLFRINVEENVERDLTGVKSQTFSK